ncbi:YesL family protein [Niallia circulans]|uniref:YesL family protein n=1 Tax=Niallia circulans TaxID=1397 RepID=A0A941GBY4_NIACI|nr:YesL family protein [Niallia circulans]MCB5237510.1 YesL family protein [Niallia circulans]
MRVEIGGWSGKIYDVCQWITRLAYINLLWIIFSALGLFIGGLFPSTVAMVTIIRKWLQRETDISVLNTYWQTYKQEFGKANKLGAVVFAFIVFIYMDWRIISSIQGSVNVVLLGLLIGGIFLAFLTLLYLFPVYVHYELEVLQYFKVAFFLACTHPLHTLSMIIGVCTMIFLGVVFTGAGLLFLGSGLASIILYFSKPIFTKMDELRITKLQQSDIQN